MKEAREVIAGTIVQYSDVRGFGFIESDERRPDGRDYFFHIKHYRDVGRDPDGTLALCERGKNVREPNVGDRVVFCPFEDTRGPAAALWTCESRWEEWVAHLAKIESTATA